MNEDTLEGQWTQLKGQVREQWGVVLLPARPHATLYQAKSEGRNRVKVA